MNEETKYFTAQQVAEKLQVNVMTIYRYLKSGKLNGYKFGKEFRVSSQEFDSFLLESKIKQQTNNE